MARLCQKALRRSQAGLGLSRALHSSRRDRQQSLDRSRRDPRQLPLEGLSGKRRSPEQSHANHDRRVHSPLPPPCAAEWLPSHSQLRPSLPTDIAPTSLHFVEACSVSPLRRWIATTMMTTTQAPPTTNHPRALAAAVV